MTAPEELRHRLRGLPTKELVSVVARFRLGDGPRDVPTATKFALRSVARRHEALSAEIVELDAHLDRLVALLAFAVLGHAHWFFGNLYEAVVLIPQFAAAPEQRLPISAGGVLVPGSPALYYVPMLPLTVPAALAALALGWRVLEASGEEASLGPAPKIASDAVGLA